MSEKEGTAAISMNYYSEVRRATFQGPMEWKPDAVEKFSNVPLTGHIGRQQEISSHKRARVAATVCIEFHKLMKWITVRNRSMKNAT